MGRGGRPRLRRGGPCVLAPPQAAPPPRWGPSQEGAWLAGWAGQPRALPTAEQCLTEPELPGQASAPTGIKALLPHTALTAHTAGASGGGEFHWRSRQAEGNGMWAQLTLWQAADTVGCAAFSKGWKAGEASGGLSQVL